MTTGSSPWSGLITSDRILDLHKESMRRFGGGGGAKQNVTAETIPCVDGSLGSAWSAGLYNEPEDMTLCFCGYAVFYLVKNHCFVDGNKRVAWAVAVEVMGHRGLSFGAEDKEAEAMLLSAINGELDAMGVVRWMAHHLGPLPS